MKVTPSSSVRIEVDALLQLLHEGHLCASWMARTLADPFANDIYGDTPHAPRFVFSDIPDIQFREPCDIIEMSDVKGGNKS